MAKLDPRGIIAVVELVIYIPILILSTILVLRHGFTKRSGWIFLLILSIVRFVGGAMHIAAELETSPSATLRIVYAILEGAGLSPLLLATLGFLSTIAQHGFYESDEILVTRGLRIMGLLNSVALALTIAGGSIAGRANGVQSDINQGTNLRHIGAILFIVQFALVFLMHGFFWMHRERILKHRRTMLLGISLALPFLCVRLLYSALSAFSPVEVPGAPPSDSSLVKFSSTTGSWALYLVMSVMMEYAAVLIYVTVGTRIPLQNDYGNGKQGRYSHEELSTLTHD